MIFNPEKIVKMAVNVEALFNRIGKKLPRDL